MPQVRHATPPGNPNSSICRGATRYRFAQAQHFAQRHKRRFGQYSGNLPRGAVIAIKQSGFSGTICSRLKNTFRAVITYCLRHTERGYLLRRDLRATLQADGICRSNVTPYIERMLAAGILTHVADDVFRIGFYNCGTQKRQDELVQKMDERQAKRRAKTSTYKKPEPYTPRAKALRVCKNIASQKKIKTKTSPPKPSQVSHACLAPCIVPVAKQGVSQQAVAALAQTAPPVPPLPVFPKPEEACRGVVDVAAMLARKLPKGFAIPHLAQSIVARRTDPTLAVSYTPSVSEAYARGHRRAQVAPPRARQAPGRRGPLVPISHTTARFLRPGYG